MSDPEKEFVKKLYKAGTIRLLVVIFNMSWSIDDLESHIVVIHIFETILQIDLTFTA